MKNFCRFGWVFGVLLLLVGWGRAGDKTVALASAGEAGWELIFRDEFNREELGNAWEVDEGDWSLEDGALKGSGILISRRGFPDDSFGFTRLEFEVETDVQPIMLLPGAPPPEVEISDLSAFIHSRPRAKSGAAPWRSGYFFQFGGNLNRENRLRREGVELWVDCDPERRIVPGKRHQIVVENDDGHLRMFVDGALIVERKDPSPFVAFGDYNRVGFYFLTRVKLHRVRVYIKRLDDMDHFI